MPTVPSNASDVEAMVSARLSALQERAGAKETVTVDWRGQKVALDVIDMPVGLLTYNPETHRIRAQKSLDAAREAELASNPFSADSQGFLHDLLRGAPDDPTKTDPAFEQLVESLRVHGQEEPGIITRFGVLVNGNTRCAALRDLQRPNIRVAVLPSDAGFDDIRSVELALQLRREYKRDYSFMNTLLALEEAVESGPAADALRDFRITQASLDRSLWILAFIREAIQRSRVQHPDGSSSQLSLVDFESDQGKLEELYRTFASLAKQDPERAGALREQRMLLIALGRSKTDLRLVDESFIETHAPSLQTLPAPDPTAIARIPGTSIPVAPSNNKLEGLKQLTDRALQARSVTSAVAKGASIPDAHERTVRAQELARLVEKGLDSAGRTARLVKRQSAPIEKLGDAIDQLDAATAALAAAKSSGLLDATQVDEVLQRLMTAVIALARQVPASTGDATSGVSWLHRAAAASVTA